MTSIMDWEKALGSKSLQARIQEMDPFSTYYLATVSEASLEGVTATVEGQTRNTTMLTDYAWKHGAKRVVLATSDPDDEIWLMMKFMPLKPCRTKEEIIYELNRYE
jgi:hypothetical protein